MALGQGVEGARQDVPGESQERHDGPTQGPPGPPPAGASDQFSSQTLSSLISAQEQANGDDDLASRLIGDADADGDGLLSLTEVQSTLGGDDGESTGLTAALGAIDTDGDGKLSASELSAVLEKGKAQHAHHGHRHARPAEAADPSETDADTDASQATEAA
jgi:hypothetical protein